MRIERSVVIAAPPSRVWSVLTDWEGQASWMPDVAWIRVVGDGRRELGAELDVRTKVFGVPLFVDRLTVIAWRAPSILSIDHTGIVRGRGTWRLEPFGSGTRLVWIEWLGSRFGPLGELALQLYHPIQARLLDSSLRNVKALCAAGPNR